jgi:hypothetical protein
MNTPVIKYGFYFLIIFLLTNSGRAEQANTVDNETQALREQVAELKQKMKDANERHTEEIKLLKEEIKIIKQGQIKVMQEINPVEPNRPQESIPCHVEQKSASTGLGYPNFNPEVSAIGDVLFHAGKDDENEKKNQFRFRELELALGSLVDPYGRADFFIGIHNENDEWHTHLEEGYFTFDSLPYDLIARAGQFYTAFGKANQMHTHAMPWVDKPSVIKNFFGEEGMSEAGAELSWLVPNPWDYYLEITQEVQNNGNDASFAGSQSDDLMYVTHLKNFFDVDRNSSIELGGSFATGSNASTGGDHRTNIEGIDLTYKWRHPQQGLYKSLTWMSEALFSQKEQGADNTVNSYGLYSSLEYQFARRWSAFGRYDYSQFPDDDDSRENAFSTGLTFKQSEFCFWRLQYKHTDAKGEQTTDNDRDELFLQLNFGIGPHRAHQY